MRSLAAALLLFALLPLAPTLPSTLQAAPRPILDEATLQREYQAYRASVKGMRLYHVRYIRVAEEAAAQDLIARIRSGADFRDVARKHSIHEQSATSGGDLGTHATCRWAKATLEILDSLKRGQTWPKPVKGTHGWGIYRLESVAELEPRSFEQYKAELLAGKFEGECPWEPPVTIAPAPAPGPSGIQRN
jgi:parvulin-like peptidyl-prolyl isomerase